MSLAIDQKVKKFFSKYKPRHYDKGQIIIFAGDVPSYVFYLEQGTVRQYDVSHKGEEIVVNVFKPGVFFPMSWAMNKTPNEYFFEAATAVDVRLANPPDTVAFLKKNPDVLYDLLSRVYLGTDGLLKRMVYLMGGSAQGRLMYEILIECRRFGNKQKDEQCEITITETELAARSGLSRETISREMRKISGSGILKISKGKIVINDMKLFQEKIAKSF